MKRRWRRKIRRRNRRRKRKRRTPYQRQRYCGYNITNQKKTIKLKGLKEFKRYVNKDVFQKKRKLKTSKAG